MKLNPNAPPAPAKVVRPPFTIVVDTREQAPWRFNAIPGSGGVVYTPTVTTASLKTGDYSVFNSGFDTLVEKGEADPLPVAVERKSLTDLFGSVGRERDRFEREFERLQALAWSAVVVEADEHQIAHNPPPRTSVTPATVLGTIESWSIRYPRTHWFLCPTRRAAEVRCFNLLRRWWEHNAKGDAKC